MNSDKKMLAINQNTKRLLKADKNISNISDDVSLVFIFVYLLFYPLSILKEEIDEKDLIYIENLSNIKFDNNYMNLTPFNNSLNNLNDELQANSSNFNSQRKRIKPAEALTKSPLLKWNEPLEDWRALVTEDIFDNNNIKSPSKNQTPVNRRYTLNVFDVSKKKNSEKLVHNSRHSLNMNKREHKVSDSLELAKKKLLEAAYLKSGPGYHDFGFVSLQELVKVRNLLRDQCCCCFLGNHFKYILDLLHFNELRQFFVGYE